MKIEAILSHLKPSANEKCSIFALEKGNDPLTGQKESIPIPRSDFIILISHRDLENFNISIVQSLNF